MIATKVFEDMHKVFVKDGYPTSQIVTNFLPDFIEDVAEEWGYMTSAMPSHIYSDIDAFLESSGKYGEVIIAENGDIFTYTRIAEKTGDIVWNGDDEYFEEIKTTAINLEKVESVDNLPLLLTIAPEDLTSKMLENCACELVSALFQ